MGSLTETRQTRQTPTNGGIVGPKNPTNPTTPYRGVGLSGGVAGELGETDLSAYRPTPPKINPTKEKEGLQADLRPVAAVAANAGQAAALVAAGRLLQSKSWPGGKKKIERASGENYPEAVGRVIADLRDVERARLRGWVSWVRSYERAEGVERR